MSFFYKNRTVSQEISKQVQNSLTRCNQYVSLINESTNAKQFFSTFNNFINELRSIIPVEKYIKFSGEKPSIALSRILREKEKTIDDFIKRSANFIKNELPRFTSNDSKIRYIDMRKNELLEFKNELTRQNLSALNYFYTLDYMEDLIGGYSNDTWHKSYANNYKYHSVLKAHSEYLEKINMLYTIANNLTIPNSPEMQQVISLCLKDIQLAPQYKEYYLNNAKIFNNDATLPIYPSFKRLAIIYEKQKEYQKAIDICKYAIELGFYKDGTPGQIPGRLAKLIKKSGQTNKTLQ